MSGGHLFSTDRSGAETMPMNAMEVLTLLLLVFTALSFLDDRYKSSKLD